MTESIACHVDPGFAEWISRVEGTLVVTTYQARKIVLVGHDGRQVTVLVRDMEVPMGLAVDGARLAVALRDTVTVLADAPELAPDLPGHPRGQFRHLYLPRVSYATGDVRAHELAFGSEGLWIVNTRFSCLCLASDQYSFVPRWTPRFVTECVPEDRCHLSGLATERGAPAFVTAHAPTDVQSGWREQKLGGGVVVDVAAGEVVASGFMMPHSPRVDGGALWVLDSGRGELVKIDRASGARTSVARLPGFARGLCFVGHHAVVGLSRIRETNIFGGVPIAERHDELVCGVAVIDTRSGRLEGVLRFTSGCEEIFDVALLEGKKRVHLLDASKAEGRLALSAPGLGYWVVPASER